MMFGPVHHAGYIVKPLEPAERHFVDLGYERLMPPAIDSGYDARILFLRRPAAQPGEPLIELIEPLSEQSPVYAHLKQNKLQIHHLCFAVDDIERAVAAARDARLYPVGRIRNAPAIGGSRIAFLFARSAGLFELVERPPFWSTSTSSTAAPSGAAVASNS